MATCLSTVNHIPEDDGEPSENFLTQVRKYFEQESGKSTVDRHTRQISGGKIINIVHNIIVNQKVPLTQLSVMEIHLHYRHL